MKTDPLLGILHGLDSLFDRYTMESSRVNGGVNYFPETLGWYPFTGLPGSVDHHGERRLVVSPHPFVIWALQPMMTTGVIGSFRSVRSAYWMKQNLLPVFAYDAHHISNPFVALVPYSEHERFSGRAK